jgi:chromosome segregation ATPase
MPMDKVNDAKIHALEQSIKSLKTKLLAVQKEADLNKRLVTSATKEIGALKILIKQLNTRMIANEADIGHLRSKL